MTHTRWEGLRLPHHPLASQVQMAYVRGYILALEDMLDDLDREDEYQPTGGGTSQVDYIAGHELAVARLKVKVHETLRSANRTIETLEREHDREQGTSGTALPGPGVG
jgi:hypothetical protein